MYHVPILALMFLAFVFLALLDWLEGDLLDEWKAPPMADDLQTILASVQASKATKEANDAAKAELLAAAAKG